MHTQNIISSAQFADSSPQPAPLTSSLSPTELPGAKSQSSAAEKTSASAKSAQALLSTPLANPGLIARNYQTRSRCQSVAHFVNSSVGSTVPKQQAVLPKLSRKRKADTLSSPGTATDSQQLQPSQASSRPLESKRVCSNLQQDVECYKIPASPPSKATAPFTLPESIHVTHSAVEKEPALDAADPSTAFEPLPGEFLHSVLSQLVCPEDSAERLQSAEAICREAEGLLCTEDVSTDGTMVEQVSILICIS